MTFETFKDREDVLKNSKALGRSQVTVTEDLSKRTRESRQELRKFMRNIKGYSTKILAPTTANQGML